jgi:hypothetical protein
MVAGGDAARPKPGAQTPGVGVGVLGALAVGVELVGQPASFSIVVPGGDPRAGAGAEG